MSAQAVEFRPHRVGASGNMSPLAAESIMNPEVPIRDKVIAWLVNQGATTVLLFAIFWGGYQKAELVIDRFEQGYTRNAQDLAIAAKQHDDTVDKLIAQWKDDRKLLIDILRGNTAAAEAAQK